MEAGDHHAVERGAEHLVGADGVEVAHGFLGHAQVGFGLVGGLLGGAAGAQQVARAGGDALLVVQVGDGGLVLAFQLGAFDLGDDLAGGDLVGFVHRGGVQGAADLGEQGGGAVGAGIAEQLDGAD